MTFVKLELREAGGKVVSSNFYWLGARPTVYDWAKTNQSYTPVSRYEDLKQLEELPRVEVEAKAVVEKSAAGQRVRVVLRNRSGHLAFQVRLGVHRPNAEMEILPVLWSDNYVELMPGETRELTAQFSSDHILDGQTELHIDGWNVKPGVVKMSVTYPELPMSMRDH